MERMLNLAQRSLLSCVELASLAKKLVKIDFELHLTNKYYEDYNFE